MKVTTSGLWAKKKKKTPSGACTPLCHADFILACHAKFLISIDMIRFMIHYPVRDPILDPIRDPIRDLIRNTVREPLRHPIRSDPIRSDPIQILSTPDEYKA